MDQFSILSGRRWARKSSNNLLPPFASFHAILLCSSLLDTTSYSLLPVQSFPTMWVLVLAGLQMCVMYFHGALASFLSCPGRLLKFKVPNYFGAVDLANTCIGALFRGSTRLVLLYTRRIHWRIIDEQSLRKGQNTIATLSQVQVIHAGPFGPTNHPENVWAEHVA